MQREDGKKEGGREEGCGASSAAGRVLGDRQTGRMIDDHRENIIAQVGISRPSAMPQDKKQKREREHGDASSSSSSGII